VVAYPGGFELDHVVPLHLGGEDDESNCQLLCVHFEVRDGALVKLGCHADKTRADVAR
jgi:5-methylcytosine-specific restriction endonuclease McrA